jgi:PadR family transcriptional regulator, regulatory protein PadR
VRREVRQQWLHGFLELCLLCLLADRRDYGLGLSQRLAAAGFADIPGGTLYPSLLRLEKLGLVHTEREPSPSGPARKYYDLTPLGRTMAEQGRQDWRDFRQAVDVIATQVILSAEGV